MLALHALMFGTTACIDRPSASKIADGIGSRPNVVLITLCSFRFNRLGAAGYWRELTPFLDSLSEDGTFFDNAVAAASWTKPSTVSIFTALTAGVHRMNDYYKVPEILSGKVEPKRAMPENATTLAELLGDAGYETFTRVNNVHAGAYFEVTRGFEDELTDNTMKTGRMLQDLEHWLDHRDPQQPFFASIFTLDAHTPYHPDFSFYMKTRRNEEPLEERDYPRFRQDVYHRVMDRLSTVHQWPHSLQRDWIDLYDAGILQLDAALSQLRPILEDRGILSNTVIVVTADHGERFFEHGRVDHGWFPDEPVLHIPLIVAGPGIPSGQRIPDVVRSIDIYPTIAELTGITPPRMVQGVGLLARITGERKSPLDLVAVSVGLGNEYAVRRGRFKYRFSAQTGQAGLYDIEADPLEQDNLLLSRPELANEMKRLLAKEIREERALRQQIGPGRKKTVSGEMENELRSLGYLN